MKTKKLANVSPHISAKENSCNCGKCNQDIRCEPLYVMFERFREFLSQKYGFEVKLNIHCINRCKNHNWAIYKRMGMSWAKYMFKRLYNSTHVRGEGLDCHAVGISPQELINSAIECHSKDGILNGGLGIYKGWRIGGIHFDVSRFRRW